MLVLASAVHPGDMDVLDCGRKGEGGGGGMEGKKMKIMR